MRDLAVTADDRILVFIPCYNCEKQIPRVLAQFAAVPPGTFAEAVVIDNGSRDGTVTAALAALPSVSTVPVKVVRNDDNYNLGGSHKSAFAYAQAGGFSHVAVLHGDDQGDIRDLLPVLERKLHRQYDACLGARFQPGARLQGYSRFRIFGNRVFNALFSLVSGRRIHDLGSGLNVFARTVFSDPSVQHHSDDLRFNVYLLLSLIDKRRHLAFFPISWREDDQISNVRLFSQARRTLAIGAEYALRRRRFRTADHRDRPHARYTFQVVGQSAEPERREAVGDA